MNLIFGPEEEYPPSEKINYPSKLRQLQEVNADGEIEALQASDVYTDSEASQFVNQLIDKLKLSSGATISGILALGLAFVTCVVLILLVSLCMKSCVPKCHKAIKGLCQRLKNMLMFNSLLRFYIIGYLSLASGCCMIINQSVRDPEDQNILTTSLSAIMLVVLLALTYPLTRLLLNNNKKLRDKDFRQQYGALYTPCDTYKGKSPLLFFAIFCLRRFMVALIVGFLSEFTFIQIWIKLVLSSLVLLWLFKV